MFSKKPLFWALVSVYVEPDPGAILEKPVTNDDVFANDANSHPVTAQDANSACLKWVSLLHRRGTIPDQSVIVTIRVRETYGGECYEGRVRRYRTGHDAAKRYMTTMITNAAERAC